MGEICYNHSQKQIICIPISALLMGAILHCMVSQLAATHSTLVPHTQHTCTTHTAHSYHTHSILVPHTQHTCTTHTANTHSTRTTHTAHSYHTHSTLVPHTQHTRTIHTICLISLCISNTSIPLAYECGHEKVLRQSTSNLKDYTFGHQYE